MTTNNQDGWEYVWRNPIGGWICTFSDFSSFKVFTSSVLTKLLHKDVFSILSKLHCYSFSTSIVLWYICTLVELEESFEYFTKFGKQLAGIPPPWPANTKSETLSLSKRSSIHFSMFISNLKYFHFPKEVQFNSDHKI